MKMNLGALILIVALLWPFAAIQTWAQSSPTHSWEKKQLSDYYDDYFKSSRPGCFSLPRQHKNWECMQQKIQFQLLQYLSKAGSKDPRAVSYLQYLVQKRIQYFLSIGEFDYQSVLSLMVFPVKSKVKWLKLIQEQTPFKHPYTHIALLRLQQKTPPQCQTSKGKVLPPHFREICLQKIL